jgi:hypothetical protein
MGLILQEEGGIEVFCGLQEERGVVVSYGS